ncbi:MAG: hypothetical protein AAB398_00760 [Pseudomonadota bacterium]
MHLQVLQVFANIFATMGDARGEIRRAFFMAGDGARMVHGMVHSGDLFRDSHPGEGRAVVAQFVVGRLP